MYINSSENQYIKLAKSLHSKAGRKKSGSFLIEGEKILEEAFKNNIEIEYIFTLDESAAQHIDIEKFLAPNKNKVNEAPVFMVDESLMKKITTTESLVSTIAIAKQFEKIAPVNDNFILYCEEIQDPGNLGSIIRSAFAAGVTSIKLSENCADIFNPKTVRSSKGVMFCGAIEKNVSLKDLDKFDHLKIGSSLNTDTDYSNMKEKLNGKVLLMAGNEANGLSNEAQEACDLLVKIPMANNIESLNVTAATSIFLFEIKKVLT